MPNYTIYQIDAFTNHIFGGNPAAVCPLEEWPDDRLMQQIAAENNVSETAFFVRRGPVFDIRWFTPTVEVDLCGHATLAAAYALFHHEGYGSGTIRFDSPRSGALAVARDQDFLTLDFPADEVNPIAVSADLSSCFDREPLAVFRGKTDFMFVFEDEASIRDLVPSFKDIAGLDARGVIATAKGDRTDFVSRFFAPQAGINEDPVTGSAHTMLTPYWSKRLQKNDLDAMQLSERGGFLKCGIRHDRVAIGGQARLYLKGEIYIR